ncbi:MAG: hypothetical protein K6E93_03775 [Bacteroidales bacterium]|nr:hypothetical protein [Bacteroidales bacterium]
MQRADSLMAAGDYALAAVEYERCYYQAESRALSHRALSQKAMCYKLLGEYDMAAATLVRMPVTHEEKCQAALLYFLSGQYDKALDVAERERIENDSADARLLLLSVLSLNELRRYDESRAMALKWASVLPEEEAEAAARLVDSLYAKSPKMKSVKTAQILAFLPGLGHLYAGYPLEACTAFALNALPLAFGVWQVYEGCYVTAYIGGAGLLSFTFFGQHGSSADYVERRNAKKANAFNGAVREKLLDAAQND